jgi:hypothetical protein
MIAVNLTLVLDGADDLDHADLRHALVSALTGHTVFVRGGEGHDVPALDQKPAVRVTAADIEFDADGGLTWEERTPQ